MSAGQGFDLHPLAARDITDIWEFIAADNPLAAAVSGKTSSTLSEPWCLSLIRGTGAPTSPRGLCASQWCVNT